ncbi:MAG: RluA family pseudouridine synthase [Planctomycetes bacterium]|nr:RluA family pseudouridine synthase [Planctomycetota bacterium]
MNDGFTYREQLPDRAAGRVLLDWLVERWRHGDRAHWSERLARGEVTLEGVPATGGEPLTAGRSLAWQRPPWEEPAAPLGCALLFRDDHFLAIAKPAGLPTMPSGGRYLHHTLLHQVRRRFPEATPLHRLDRGTSGLVLFARTAAARTAGSALFHDGAIERHYRGRVVGPPIAAPFTIDLPIGERPHPTLGRVFCAVAPGSAGTPGRAARTDVAPLDHDAATGRSRVAIRIGSGRPHQIRIHLAAAGWPLEGEPFFGPGGTPLEGTRARPGDVGYQLHAIALVADHPLGGAPLHLWCAPPPALRLRDEVPSAPRPA